jgi:hypothetical protein
LNIRHVAFPRLIQPVLLGGSRGIAYYTTLYLPSSIWTERTGTLLLRKPAPLEADEKLKPYLSDGRLKLVQGDAMNESDVGKLFRDKVDLLVTSVGAAIPSPHGCQD